MAELPSRRLYGAIEGPSGELEPLDEARHSRAVSEYLSDMIGQLESMARLAGLDLCGYLLSMARVEAETAARAGVIRR